MKIAICDDSKQDQALLSLKIHDYCLKHRITEEISMFNSGEDFLKSEESFDIVFMDIYLTGLDGVQVIRNYRRNPHTCVVFVTTSNDFAITAFTLNAVHYLVKPATSDNVDMAMDKCLEHIHLLPVKCVSIRTGSGSLPVPMANIIYIEVFNKVSVVHTDRSTIETYMSLSTLYKLLDHGIFLRIQRSYVVNMYAIDSFLFDRVILKNQKVIPLSRLNRSELKNQYQEFLFELAREGLV